MRTQRAARHEAATSTGPQRPAQQPSGRRAFACTIPRNVHADKSAHSPRTVSAHSRRTHAVKPGAFLVFAACVFAVGYLALHVAVALVGWRVLGIAAGLGLYAFILVSTWSATAVRGGRR